MYLYLIFLVGSVFLGAEILAIPTPVAQISFYRILAIGVPVILGIQMYLRHPNLKLSPKNPATFMILIYVIWLIWGGISVLWAWSLIDWIQGVFLLGIGIFSIVGLYFWVRNGREWSLILNTAWFMMTLLLFWGVYEILTNNYILADLSKLDPHDVFLGNVSARIPVTVFTNQNDYATMLVAYLPTGLIMYNKSKNQWMRLGYLVLLLLAVFLIYRTDSRMIFLSLFIFIAIYILLDFDWDIPKKWLWTGIGIGTLGILLIIFLVPPVQDLLSGLFYFGGDLATTGDSRRINLWRNGLLFLGETMGLGVGAGNVEYWMAERPFISVDLFTNLHNWWLEILVGYGVVIFILYVLNYIYMIFGLFQLRKRGGLIARISHAFIAFLFVFILASITSANNMLIEWHWVYFGIIISFIHVANQHQQEGCYDEFSYNY